MMIRLILLLSLFISSQAFSQQYMPNQEDQYIFKNVERSYQEIFTPVVNWPIKSQEQNHVFVSQFEIENFTIEAGVLEASYDVIVSAKINKTGHKVVIVLTTTRPMQSEKEFAKVMYSLGVEKIILEGEAVNIYHYAQKYKSISKEKIRKTRVYLD